MSNQWDAEGWGEYQSQPATAVTAGTSSTQNKSPPKANAAPKKDLISGLVEALNGYQADLVKQGVYEEPDTYKIVIVDPVLADSKIVPPGRINLKQTSMTQAKTANESKNPATQKVDNNSKTQKIMAGTSIVQFLDQVVRSSEYIYKQQLKIYDPDTGKLKDNATSNQTLAWYRIGMQAEPKLGKYDRKRNDYAYDITYQISIYAVNDVKSDYFPVSPYRGSVKAYQYWFTGKNTQVIDYSQDYNYLFFHVINSASSPRNVTSNAIELERAAYQPNSNQSSQGQDDDKVNEPGANAADYLYSPSAQGRVRVRIFGDPAWIFQGEVWSGVQGPNFNYQPFLADGTINQEGQEILFELGWKNPVDYDLNTGLQDPNNAVYKSNLSPNVAGKPTQNFVYKAYEVTSTFSRGLFEQELNGVLMTWPIKTKTDVDNKKENAKPPTSTSVPDKNKGTYRDPLVPLPEGSPGLLDLDNGATGAVNYKPTPLSRVLDNQRESKPLTGSLFQSEGFDNQALGLTEASAPTSGGQTVGPASSSAATQSQGGASGRQVGNPQTFVVLNNGGGRTVNSQAEIDALQTSGQASAREANAARRALALQQQSANSPTTSAPVQRTKRDA